MQDPRFVSSPYICMQNILIPNEYDFFQYLIPTYVGYNNLFQTRKLCSKKAVHLLQRRCPHIPHASLVSTLVPYLSWGTIFVCRPYFTLLLSTNKFVAGQIKNIILPPPTTTAPHKIFITLCMQNILIPNEFNFLPVLNSLSKCRHCQMVLQLNFVKYISCSNNRSNSICNLRD